MVNILLVEIIEETCELPDCVDDDTCKTKKEHNKKLNRNPALNRSTGFQENGKTQTGLLNKFAHIKAKGKRGQKIEGKNQKIAHSYHIITCGGSVSTV